MTGNHYVIKYSSMDQLYSIMIDRINGWYDDLDDWAKKYGKIVEMETFQGKSADAVKAYLQEVHGVLLYSIQQALMTYQSAFLLYKKGYYDIDGDKYASIPEEIIEGVVGRLKTESEQLDAIASSIQASLSSVSDIFPMSSPTKYTLDDTVLGVKDELLKYSSGIDSYEENQYLVATGNLKALLDTLQVTIQGYIMSSSDIASYQTGALAGNTNVLSLYDKVQKSSEYIANNQQAIEAAASKQAEVYAEMQAEYEAACEARKDKGTAQLIMSGVTIFVGAVAIIGTAGMATPIVVTAGVAGSCTIAYGLSNAAEGAQELYYVSIGDVSTVAFNPIRDTVFMGNQGVYDAWGRLSMTVAGLCIPVGQAVNGVAGAGTNVVVKTAAKTIIKESLKDTVYDAASGVATDFAKEKFNLSETETTILNLGLNTAIEKGVDFAGDKLSLTSKQSLAEKMPYEEAKRYNEYKQNVLNGTHNDYPELSEADIAAWHFANAKLDEHITVEKVDADALLNLRMEKLALQNSFQNATIGVIGVDVNAISSSAIDSGMITIDGVSDGGLDASISNIDEFIGGNKSFDDVVGDYAKVYADIINSNQAWTWDETIPSGENLTKKQRSIIKQQAIDAGLVPEIKITKVDGMRYGFADFEAAGVVKETVYLPEDMWKMTDDQQFSWLDEQIGGNVEGYTWHHTEVPGKMQLVPTGIHNITTHNGGRTTGMWADSPR